VLVKTRSIEPHQPVGKLLPPTGLSRIALRLVSRRRGSVSSFVRRVSRLAAGLQPGGMQLLALYCLATLAPQCHGRFCQKG